MAFYITQLSKKRWVRILSPIFIISIIIVFFATSKKDVPEYSSTVVERVDLIQSVSETGSIVAQVDVSYGWEVSGRVASVDKNVGDIVVRNELIATLSSQRQRARYNEGVALLSAARANLNVKLIGASDHDIAQSQATVDQSRAALAQARAELLRTEAVSTQAVVDAQSALQSAQNDLQLVEGGEQSVIVNDAYDDLINTMDASITTLTDAQTASDNILGIDSISANDDFENGLGYGEPLALSTAQHSYRKARDSRAVAERAIRPLHLVTNHGIIDSALVLLDDAIDLMQEHLRNMDDLLTVQIPVRDLSQAELTSMKTTINAQRTDVDKVATDKTKGLQAINAARKSLLTYQITFNSAETDLATAIQTAAADDAIARANVDAKLSNLAQRIAEHEKLTSPPREVDIASLRADANRQSANVQALASDLEQTQLRALADGVIADLDITLGEDISANSAVVTIVSDDLSVEVDVSETDIAKVAREDHVEVTLDAFGPDVVFTGSVTSIEPAETEISGVIYYTTTINLSLKEDNTQGVRPGMTANVRIVTDMAQQVLVLPRRAVLRGQDGEFVRVVLDAARGVFEERLVTTGLSGDDGLIEIKDGLSEGDEVVTFLKEQ